MIMNLVRMKLTLILAFSFSVCVYLSKVVLPLQKSKIGALVAISILILAWYLQLLVTAWLQLPFYSGVGVLQTPIGARAAQRYCL